MVMELFTGGDLRYHIGKMKRFKECEASNFNFDFFLCLFNMPKGFIIACILVALEYLHKN